jgi:hypothetical protein
MVQEKLNKNENCITLYVSANEIRHPEINKFRNLLVKSFENQYSKEKAYIEYFKKILDKDSDKIILIIDDFDSIGIKRSESQSVFLKNISENFQNVVIFANKSIEMEVLANSETRSILNSFELFRLKEFGHVLRDQLVEKWVTIGGGDSMSDGDLIEKKDEISNKIKIIVGTNFVPTHPLYLLTMLQLVGPGLSLQGSSYAELYGYLINKSLLAAKIKPEDLDFFHTYLAYISYYFFKNRKKEISESELINLYEQYSVEMDIGKKFNNVHDLLINSKLFRKESDSYQFNHNYTYYYFVAKYLADNIQDTWKIISEIIEKLYTNEYANIVIFLIHHSRNPDIINAIMKEATSLFKSFKPYSLLEEEITQVNSLIEGEVKFLLKDQKPKDYRRKELERRDKQELVDQKKKDQPEGEVRKKEDLSLFENINLTFKLIEILGQISSNYYGSLKSDKKVEIIESIHSLGFRSLRAFLENLEEFQLTLKDQVKKVVDKNKSPSTLNLDQLANRIIFAFTGGIVTVFLKKISDSVASKNLLPSIEKVVQKEQTPAVQLVDMAVKLSFPDGLNKSKISELYTTLENNHLSSAVLRVLVIEHLYKFEVKIADKNSVCDKLKIGMAQKRQMLDKKRKK